MHFEKTKILFSRAEKRAKAWLVCDERALRREALITISMYLLLLFWALWLKFNDFYLPRLNYQWLKLMSVKERFLYDIIPFQVRFDYQNQIKEIFLNGIVFAPFGVLLNHLFPKKNIWRDLVICFGVSLSIETVQLFSLIGSFATTDLIMNTLGYFIGLGVYHLIFKKRSLSGMVWFYRAVNVIIFPLSVWAIITTVNNREEIIAILTRTL